MGYDSCNLLAAIGYLYLTFHYLLIMKLTTCSITLILFLACISACKKDDSTSSGNSSGIIMGDTLGMIVMPYDSVVSNNVHYPSVDMNKDRIPDFYFREDLIPSRDYHQPISYFYRLWIKTHRSVIQL
jgi:hypothetical protein